MQVGEKKGVHEKKGRRMYDSFVEGKRPSAHKKSAKSLYYIAYNSSPFFYFFLFLFRFLYFFYRKFNFSQLYKK